VQGWIDEVDRKVSITWVQPRVLSRGQVGELGSRLEGWNEKLHRVEGRIAPELVVQA